MDGDKVNMEQTPQELVAKVRAQAGVSKDLGWRNLNPDLVLDLCTALTAALDANEEMHEAIVEWAEVGDFPAQRALRTLATTPPTGISLRAELAEAKAEVERLRELLERAVPHITNSMINPRNNDDWYRKGKQLRADIAALADAATPTHEHTYDSGAKLALVASGFVRFCDTCGQVATPEKTHSSGCRDCRWDGRRWHLCENHYRATRLAAMDEPTPETKPDSRVGWHKFTPCLCDSSPLHCERCSRPSHPDGDTRDMPDGQVATPETEQAP